MSPDTHRVVITRSDGSEDVLGVDGNETVLVAARCADLDVPFSCRWGACARCIALLREGTLEYSEHPRVLEKYGYGDYPRVSNDCAREQYVLLCIARPRTDCRVEIEPRLYQRLSRNG